MSRIYLIAYIILMLVFGYWASVSTILLPILIYITNIYLDTSYRYIFETYQSTIFLNNLSYFFLYLLAVDNHFNGNRKHLKRAAFYCYYCYVILY